MQADVEGLTTGQAARLLGLSEQSVRDFVRRGLLRAVQTPLGAIVDEEDAHRLAAKREQQHRERTRRAGRAME